MDIVKQCNAEGIKVYSDKKNHIIMQYDDIQMTINRSDDTDTNTESIKHVLEMVKAERFYKSDEYKAEFNKQLEIAILATRGGGSGARACRDTLLSLYNGNIYKADLSGWYNLDQTNRKALLYILEHHTFNHAKAIDQYLPQYQADFDRMIQEVE